MTLSDLKVRFSYTKQGQLGFDDTAAYRPRPTQTDPPVSSTKPAARSDISTIV